MKTIAILFLLPALATGALVEKAVEYAEGDATPEGFHVYDDASDGERPGILIIHQWTGLTDYAKGRARQLAELGYNVFAADIYGKGVRPATREESAQQATIYRKDRTLMRNRANAALSAIRKVPQVDPAKVAAIGYCFGGGVALELARSGADILGAVSFHGNLDTPDPKIARQIRAKILVLHGAADPHVPMEQVQAFREEMEQAGIDWQLVMYGGAVHSFTNPGAGNDPSRGSAYDEKADQRSWLAMQSFFSEIFKP